MIAGEKVQFLRWTESGAVPLHGTFLLLTKAS